ncbi:MAG: sulfotransferase domain-containing protein [Pseudomonadota bacterium]
MTPHQQKIYRENWTNFSFLRHGWLDGMLVSSKNSGTHWLKFMLSGALAEKYGIDWPPYYSEAGTARFIGSPKHKDREPGLPKLAFSHTIPHRLIDFGPVWRLSRLPNYVLLTRHPAAILVSHYEKWRDQMGVSWIEYLKGDPSGKRYKCDIYWIARFWARWAEILPRHQVMQVTYESLKADPGAALRTLSDFLALLLDDENIHIAIDAGSKENMQRFSDPDAEKNIIQHHTKPIGDYYKGEAGSIYRKLCADLFDDTLGYCLTDLSCK